MQFGCGLSAPESWLNFDASPTLRLQRVPILGSVIPRGKAYPSFPAGARYGDVVKGLPVAPGSCAGVYCSHVLEHLSLDDLRAALRNVHGYLTKGGTFRLVVPDLEIIAHEYVASSDPDAANKFMRDTLLGASERKRGLSGLMRTWLGNSAHFWMWDFKSLAKELEGAYFRDIRRASFGDSPDARFSEVEDPERWERCLGIECIAGQETGSDPL